MHISTAIRSSITIIADVSIAVSAPKGLVVPVIRNAESLSMAEVEAAVVELATKAKTTNSLLKK